MFEGYGRNKYKSTGVIQWMLNNSWPGIIWHLYDYSLRPAGGYFGTKKALEPLHVQFSYDDRGVAVVNSTQQPEKNLKVSAKLYSLDAKELFSQGSRHRRGSRRRRPAIRRSGAAANNTAYFLALELHRPNGELASRNFYWLSAKPDVLAFDQTKWFYTPLTAFADFTPLQTMPKASVKATLKTQESGDETAGKVLVENSGGSIAFLVRLRLLKGKDGAEILPVFWEDNYISLLPGEKREIAVRLRKTDAGKSKPVLAIDGYNVAPTQ